MGRAISQRRDTKFGKRLALRAHSISLLTKDGGVRATFRPALTPQQYDALATAIKHDGDTVAEMTELLKKLALSWDCQVIVDPV